MQPDDINNLMLTQAKKINCESWVAGNKRMIVVFTWHGCSVARALAAKDSNLSVIPGDPAFHIPLFLAGVSINLKVIDIT